MRFLVTGVTGFLGWRTATLLGERGHDVIALSRPGHVDRAASQDLQTVEQVGGRARVLAHRARRVLAGAGRVGDAGEVQHHVAAAHQIARGGVAGVARNKRAWHLCCVGSLGRLL